MVNSLNRIGLSPNCSVDNRKLAVELAQLIITWELQRSANHSTFVDATGFNTTPCTSSVPSTTPSAVASGGDVAEGGGTTRKRVPSEESSVSERGVKRVKLDTFPGKIEGGVTAEATGAVAAATPSVDEDFKPSAAIVEVAPLLFDKRNGGRVAVYSFAHALPYALPPATHTLGAHQLLDPGGTHRG